MFLVVTDILELQSCSVVETDAVDGVPWASGTTYAKDADVRYNHVRYRSLAAGNIGNVPSDTTTGVDAKWQERGATAPYLALDAYSETVTTGEAGQPLTYVLGYRQMDSFALINMTGASVTVTVRDGDEDETIFFEETYDLIEDIADISLFQYNYYPIKMKTKVVEVNLPLGIQGTLSISLENGDAAPSIGFILAGHGRYIGSTDWGVEVGIEDYSKKIVDEFGVTRLIKRSYADTLKAQVFVGPDEADYVCNLLRSVRATPCLFVGDNNDGYYTSLTVYGWIEDWYIVFSNWGQRQLSLEVQGLI